MASEGHIRVTCYLNLIKVKRFAKNAKSQQHAKIQSQHSSKQEKFKLVPDNKN